MTLHRFVLCLPLAVGSFVMCSNVLSAQNFYPQDEVLNVKSFWERQVAEVTEQSIKPSLAPDQLRVANGITWEFPTDTNSNLVRFGASGSHVVLPIRSWMLLQDLVVAYLWQDVNHCPPTVFMYSNLLKNRDPASLPGGTFPDPIAAMGIPSPNTATLAHLSPEFAARFERVFYGILLFVTAHEVGHVVLRHSAPGSVDKEIEADDFAFSILAKSQIDPSGVMVFFLLVAPLLPTDDELAATNRRVDHPMSGRRIHSLGSRLIDHPTSYYPNARDSDPRLAKLKEVGAGLMRVGDSIDNFSKRRELETVALNTSLSELGACPLTQKPTVP